MTSWLNVVPDGPNLKYRPDSTTSAGVSEGREDGVVTIILFTGFPEASTAFVPL